MAKKHHLLFGIALTALIAASPSLTFAANKGGSGFDPSGYKGGGNNDPTQDRSGEFDTTDTSRSSDNYNKGTIPPSQYGDMDYKNGSTGGFKPGDPNLAKEAFLNNVGIYNGTMTLNDVESTVGNVSSVNDLFNELKSYANSGISSAITAARSIPGFNAVVAIIGIHSDAVSYQSDISAYYNNGNHIEDLGMAIANGVKVGMDAIVVTAEGAMIIGALGVAGGASATVALTGGVIIAGTATVATAMTLSGLVGTATGNLYAMFVDNRGNQYLVPVLRSQAKETPQDRYDRRGGDGNRPGNPRGGL